MAVKARRGKIMAGAATVLVGLGVASVAAACTPTHTSTNFVVDPTEGSTGTLMTAAGSNLEKANHPYTIKLINGDFDTNNDERCGMFGIPQAETVTGFQGDSKSFVQPFVLNAGTFAAGNAHICAIPGAEPTTASTLGSIGYYAPFTII